MSDKDLNIFSDTLACVEQWAEKWPLLVSIEKSSSMLFSQAWILLNGSNLKLSHQVLASMTKTLDLGNTFEPDLKFNDQISQMCSKAKQRLYMIKKRILSSDPGLLIKVYKMYVLPILSYCSPIWNPHTHENIIKIEKIQKSFTKTLAGYTVSTLATMKG